MSDLSPLSLSEGCSFAADGDVSQRLRKLLGYYSDQLERMADFWCRNALDRECGGYLVPLSREGRVVATDKNMWCQARMTWMFSALYRFYDARPHWLDAARLGRDFVVKHGYRGEGRWAYLLSRRGRVLNESRSLVTDNNTAMALAEFANATGQDDDLELVRDTAQQYYQRVGPPAVDEWYHHQLPAHYLHNATDMVTLGGVPAIRPFLPATQIDEIVAAATERILFVYAKDDYRTLFEAVGTDGEVVHDERGQRVNPGHALEACWFCLHEALHVGDRRKIDRAVEVTRWSFELGWDVERRGIVAFTKPGGGQPNGPEAPVPWGERWNERIWWVHSEALYALALAGAVSGDPWFVDALEKVHDYIDEFFVDHEHGEWYPYLDPDGQVVITQKGTWIKCFFHVPRNLMMLISLLRRLSA